MGDVLQIPVAMTQENINEIVYAIDDLLDEATQADPPLPEAMATRMRVAVFNGLREKILLPGEFQAFKENLVNSYREILKDPTTAPQPRPLTAEEISYILNESEKFLPDSSPVPDIASAMIENMKMLVRYQLWQIRLTPLGIEPMIATIVRSYLKAMISPGTNVGGFAADAFSVHATQGALDSFHRSGSAKNITSGIKGMEELLGVRKERANPSSTISFVTPVTYEEVLTDKVADLVQLLVVDPKSIAERIQGQAEGDPDNLKNNGVVLTIDLDKIVDLHFQKEGDVSGSERIEPWWYDAYRSLVDTSFPVITPGDQEDEEYIPYNGLSPHALRLSINISKLHSRKVTLEQVAEAIRNGSKREALVCVPSPIIKTDVIENPETGERTKASISFIDVFVVTSRVQTTDIQKGDLPPFISKNIGLFFLQMSVIPGLTKTLIKGVPKIEELYPVRNSITSAILDQIYLGYEVVTLADVLKMQPPAQDPPEGMAALIYGSATNGSAIDPTIASIIPYPVFHWRFRLNYRIISKKNISPESVAYLLRYVGIRVNSNMVTPDQSYIDVTIPLLERPIDFNVVMNQKQNPNMFKYMTDDQAEQIRGIEGVNSIVDNFMLPLDYVNYLIRKSGKKVKTQQKANKEERNRLISEGKLYEARRIRITPPAPTIISRSEFILVDTDGDNMENVYNLSEIDPYCSYGNNLFGILKTLGIEALRSYMIQELIISTGSSLDPRHIELMVDYMMRLGFVSRFTKSGYSYQKSSPFLEAMLGDIEGIERAALYGTTIDTSAMATSVVLGKMPAVGTGTINVSYDDTNFEHDVVENITSGTITTLDAEALDAEFWSQRVEPILAYETAEGGYTDLYGGNLETDLINVTDEPTTVSGAVVSYRLKPAATTEVQKQLADNSDVALMTSEDSSIVMNSFPPGNEIQEISVGDQISLNVIEENMEGERPMFDEEDFF